MDIGLQDTKYFLQDPGANLAAMDCGDIYSWNETSVAYILNEAPEEIIQHDGSTLTASARCDECGKARRILWQECECGSETIEGFLVAPEDSGLVVDTGAALDRVWYHATDREDWLDSIIEAGLGVHLGSHQTAVEHGDYQYRYNDSYTLYALRIAPQSTVAKLLCPDLSDRWSNDLSALTEDFVAYVNAFESPGQISLYGAPQRLLVESVETISC